MTATTAHLARTSRTAAPRRPLRLTRRGRVAVVLLLLLALLAVGFCLGHVSGSHAAGTAAPRTVVVQPGDTLWSIAATADPGQDPRGVVSRLTALNHLQGASVQVGQRLTLPS